MIMKMHSYMSTNGYLQKVNRDFNAAMKTLRSATSRVGGWDTALIEARASSLENRHSGSSTSSRGMDVDVTPSLTPQMMPDGTTKSYIDGNMALALRNRLLAVPGSIDAESARIKDGANVNGSGHAVEENEKKEPEYAILLYHPDSEIANLAQELSDMDNELTSTGKTRIRWPNNISYSNFADYQLIPTLVYELEYPRTNRYA